MPDSNTLDAWITEQINRSIPEGQTWTPREIAEKLVAHLDETDPARFADWMRENAVRLLHQTINGRHRSERARIIRRAKAVQFGHNAERYSDGDESAFDPYLIPFKIDEETGLTARLGDMTGKDCLRAAGPFRRREAENALQAAFLEQIGRKAGNKKVKNVYSREQLIAMFSSIGLEMAS